MSVFNALNAAIYSRLSGGTALINLLGGTAIYYDLAPEKASLPFVVFSHQGGGPENTNPSDMRSQLVFVRAYSRISTQAGSIDAACSTLLHGKALSVSGYTNYWTVRETDITLYESPPDGNHVYCCGALYRVNLDA